jgi:hypothetical protein
VHVLDCERRKAFVAIDARVGDRLLDDRLERRLRRRRAR